MESAANQHLSAGVHTFAEKLNFKFVVAGRRFSRPITGIVALHKDRCLTAAPDPCAHKIADRIDFRRFDAREKKGERPRKDSGKERNVG